MANKHEIIVQAVISDWSVQGRGRLYTMQQGLMTPWGSDNPIWIGPYPGKREKGFPDIFGFEFAEYEIDKTPIYTVVEVKTIVYPTLTKKQKMYLDYVIHIKGQAYVARESGDSYVLNSWPEGKG